MLVIYNELAVPAFAISADELNKFWIANQVYKLLEFEDNPDDVISIVSEDLYTNDKV